MTEDDFNTLVKKLLDAFNVLRWRWLKEEGIRLIIISPTQMKLESESLRVRVRVRVRDRVRVSQSQR